MKVYYNQADSRWANYPYTSNAHPYATVKSSGCGPTSGAMVLSTYVSTMFPNQVAQMFKDNGFRAEEGTSLSAFPWIAQKYGFKFEQTNNIYKAVEYLHRGGMVVCSCYGGGLFSTGGHIIVLAGMRDANTIVVYDPYLYDGKFNNYGRVGKVEVDGNNVYCSINNFVNYANCQVYFCYEPKITTPNNTYRSHVQDIGWMQPVRLGQVSGTTGQAKRLEAIIVNVPNVQYRVHIQDYGWSKWFNAGELAGTIGEERRIEAINFKSNKKLKAQGHVQDIGWQKEQVGTNITIGTTGKAKRLEAFKFNFA